MKGVKSISSIFLALVVFISAIGHVSIIHYCTMAETDCAVKANQCCCQEEKSNAIKNEASCCLNLQQYLINPFSVRQPESKTEKINIVAAELILPYLDFVKISYLARDTFKKDDSKPPPVATNRQALLNTFLI